MKLDVPFYKQETVTDCGPTTLKMVLDFFGENVDKKKLTELALIETSGATWTEGLAIATARLGYKTEYYTILHGLNKENYEFDHYKTYTDGMKECEEKHEKFKELCKKYNVSVFEKELTLEEILSKISQNCVAIILLDWNIVDKDRYGSYNGHFVPIVGYTDNSVLIHLQSGSEARPYVEIPKAVFDQARKAKGTDEDIVFIFRKSV